MDAFRIAATLHSPHYLPAYLAQELGYYDDENLAVSVCVPEPWELALDYLDTGRADAVLGGAWLPAMYFAGVRRYRIFAQLSARYPLALVSRNPVTPGDWTWLCDKTVLVSGAGGVAAFVLLSALMREHGIAPSSVEFVRELSPTMQQELFLAGVGDGLVVNTLVAQRLVGQGQAHASIELDLVGSELPSSVYYTTDEILARPARLPHRFARALQRAINWLQIHGVAGDEVARLLRCKWPGVDPVELRSTVERYLSAGYWAGGVHISADGLARLQGMLIENRLLAAAIPYSELVDERVAAYAVAQG